MRRTRGRRRGHLWQNRFFSCALDEAHTWAAVRYVERNPVRAALIGQAEDWPWSSVRARLGYERGPLDLDLRAWRERFGVDEWRRYLGREEMTEAEATLRGNTYTGVQRMKLSCARR